MWRTEDGVLHTASAADPAVFIGRDAAKLIRKLRRRDIKQLTAWVEAEMDRIFDVAEGGLDRDLWPDAPSEWPDRPLLGHVEDVAGIIAAFDDVPNEWKLDVLSTLDEHMP